MPEVHSKQHNILENVDQLILTGRHPEGQESRL